MWPLRAPHRAVQLVDAAETQESITLLAKAIGRLTAHPSDSKLIMAEAVFRIDEQNAVIRKLDSEVNELKALLSDVRADLLTRAKAVKRSDGVVVVDLSHSIWLKIKEAIK
jgi:chromosome condensin MukBEF ATPase and DNA-binding subunit MukB